MKTYTEEEVIRLCKLAHQAGQYHESILYSDPDVGHAIYKSDDHWTDVHSFDEWLKRELSATDFPLRRKELVLKFAHDIKKGSTFCLEHAPFIDEDHLYAVWLRVNGIK